MKSRVRVSSDECSFKWTQGGNLGFFETPLALALTSFAKSKVTTLVAQKRRQKSTS